MGNSTKHLFFLFLFLPLFGWGQTHTWNGNGGDTNWFNASNWDTNTVPDATSDVLIPSGFTVDITTNNASVGFMTIQANALLEVNNSMSITTGIDIMEAGYFLYALGTLSGDATITNHGTFEITGVSNKLIYQLTINNENLLLITETGIINVRDNMSFNNAENAMIIANGSGGAWSSNETGATFNNFGTFQKVDIGQFGVFYLLLTINNHGIINVGKSQTVLVLSPQNSLNNFETGILTGEGSFDITAPFTNTGIIRPDGNQAAELDFANTFTLSPQSRIELDFFGNLSDEYDKLEVIDDPFIQGNIEITLHYEAAIDDTFTIITTSFGISGCDLPPSIFTVYQGMQYEFEVSCTFDEVILTVVDKALNVGDFERMHLTAVPNPSRGSFDIQFGEVISEVELSLSNILGQTLSKNTVQNTDSYQLTIDGAPGIYFITAKTPTKTESLKLIKK